MSCSRWHRLVALYVGEDLDRARTERVRQHLAGCPSCRDLEHDLRWDLQNLRDLDSAATADLELGSVRGPVMAEIETRRTRGLVFSQPRLLTAVAAAVVVIALALLFRQIGMRDVPRTVSRETPSPAPGLVAAPEPRERSLPQSPPVVLRPTPNTSDTRLVRAESPQPGQTASSRQPVPAEPMTIKILTDDPEVVIYWIVDPKGVENVEVS
jgi:anti-sigma factor RsiW